jgi:hypothetical protein
VPEGSIAFIRRVVAWILGKLRLTSSSANLFSPASFCFALNASASLTKAKTRERIKIGTSEVERDERENTHLHFPSFDE